MLVEKGRLVLSLDVLDWIRTALSRPGIRLLDLDPETAVLSTRLPGEFHGDPADRLIVATCMKYGAPLINRDRQINEWGRIRVIW